ncbi:MAG: CoA pyrophosphatase [Actinomycetota bacterium]|nr:CoA pyrophosphatase [Actinomycetota bacterium]
MSDPDFTVAAVVRACAALPAPLPPQYYFWDPPEIKPSSLIVPVVEVDGEAALILTKRALEMRNHAGDWVFPGGRIDPAVDIDSRAGALRELQEELGPDPAHVTVIGALDSRGPILSGHVIDVFIGLVAAAALIKPDPSEVSDVAVVPLREFATANSHYVSQNLPGGGRAATMPSRRSEPIEMHFFNFGNDQLVWGTQGEIIWDLLSCVLGDRPTIAEIRS